MSTTQPPDRDGTRHWIHWTCLACDHGFRSRTRRGLWLTCPSCGEVQRGPEGVRQALAELGRLKTRRRRGAPAPVTTEVTI